MKIFLDANVLFSAADRGSATRMVLERAARKATLLTSPYAGEEARRNIAMKRPPLTDGLNSLQAKVEWTRAYVLPDDVEVTDKDKPVIAGAVGASCDVLWTSDRRHFGRFYGRTIHGVEILSSIGLVDRLEDLAESLRAE
jgi:uncharacterized protein